MTDLEKTKKLRALRLAKEADEKAIRARRQAAREAAALLLIEDLTRRARRSNQTGVIDPILDRLVGIQR